MNIFLGLLGVILSLLLIIYRVPVRRFMGKIGWAESHLGPGSTYSVLLFVGIFGFFFSLMWMTGTLDLLFGGFFRLFFGSAT